MRLGRDGAQITHLSCACGAAEGDAAGRLGAKTCAAVLRQVKLVAFEGHSTTDGGKRTLDSLLSKAAEDALNMGAVKRRERASRRVLEGNSDRYGASRPDHSHAEFVERLREQRMEVDYASFGAEADDWKSALLTKVARQITGFAELKADYRVGTVKTYYGRAPLVLRAADDDGIMRWTLGESLYDTKSLGRSNKTCTVCNRTFQAIGGHLNGQPHATAVAERLMKLVNWLNRARKRSGVVAHRPQRTLAAPLFFEEAAA